MAACMVIKEWRRKREVLSGIQFAGGVLVEKVQDIQSPLTRFNMGYRGPYYSIPRAIIYLLKGDYKDSDFG